MINVNSLHLQICPWIHTYWCHVITEEQGFYALYGKCHAITGEQAFYALCGKCCMNKVLNVGVLITTRELCHHDCEQVQELLFLMKRLLILLSGSCSHTLEVSNSCFPQSCQAAKSSTVYTQCLLSWNHFGIHAGHHRPTCVVSTTNTKTIPWK